MGTAIGLIIGLAGLVVAIKSGPEVMRALKEILLEVKKRGHLAQGGQPDFPAPVSQSTLVEGGGEILAMGSSEKAIRVAPTPKEELNYELYYYWRSTTEAKEASDWERIGELTREWFKLDPNDSECLWLRAWSLLDEPCLADTFEEQDAIRKKRKGEASGLFDRAINLDPHNPMLHYQRGFFRAQHVSTKKAIQDLTVSIQLAPSSKSYWLRGLLYEIMEQHEESLMDFNEFVIRNPRHAKARRIRARVLEKCEKFDASKHDTHCANLLDGSWRRKYGLVGAALMGISIGVLLVYWLIVKVAIGSDFGLTPLLTMVFLAVVVGGIISSWGIPSGESHESDFWGYKDLSRYKFSRTHPTIDAIMPPCWWMESRKAFDEVGVSNK